MARVRYVDSQAKIFLILYPRLKTMFVDRLALRQGSIYFKIHLFHFLYFYNSTLTNTLTHSLSSYQVLLLIGQLSDPIDTTLEMFFQPHHSVSLLYIQSLTIAIVFELIYYTNGHFQHMTDIHKHIQNTMPTFYITQFFVGYIS